MCSGYNPKPVNWSKDQRPKREPLASFASPLYMVALMTSCQTCMSLNPSKWHHSLTWCIEMSLAMHLVTIVRSQFGIELRQTTWHTLKFSTHIFTHTFKLWLRDIYTIHTHFLQNQKRLNCRPKRWHGSCKINLLYFTGPRSNIFYLVAWSRSALLWCPNICDWWYIPRVRPERCLNEKGNKLYSYKTIKLHFPH